MTTPNSIAAVDHETQLSQLRQGIDAVSARITSLSLERGELALKAENGDVDALAKLEAITAELREANERESALEDAVRAAQRHQERAERDSAAQRKAQRHAEVAALVQSLRSASRKADLAAKSFANAAGDVVAIRALLSEYRDVHGLHDSQIDPPWSFGASLATTGRLLVERLDLRPVAYQTMTEQLELLSQRFPASTEN